MLTAFNGAMDSSHTFLCKKMTLLIGIRTAASPARCAEVLLLALDRTFKVYNIARTKERYGRYYIDVAHEDVSRPYNVLEVNLTKSHHD